MTNLFRISGVFLFLTIILAGCVKEKLPEIDTLDPYAIDAFSAISGGNITSDGGSPIVSRGVCWNITQNPTTTDSHTNDGSGSGMFQSFITGLTSSTVYYIRAFATNNLGTGYGHQISFTTNIDIIFNPNLNYGSVTDIDGNSYKTIQIGTQTWMAENLKTTKFNDGTDIPLIIDNLAWQNLITPGYCWYNNDAPTNKATYGALYNWYTVNTGKLCPTGWHVFSDAEWESMTTFLGGIPEHFQNKLKETGTTHWYLNNPGQLHYATNSSGFTALPGGFRYSNGFSQIRSEGHWWTSDEFDTTTAYGYSLYFFDMGGFPEIIAKGLGLSVRCIKDI